ERYCGWPCSASVSPSSGVFASMTAASSRAAVLRAARPGAAESCLPGSFLRGRGALWFMPLPISRVQALVERPAPHDPAPAGRQRPHDHGPLLGPVGLRPHGLGLGACGAVGLPADRPCRSPPQGPDALPTVPWSGEGEPLFHSSAMACSAAIRFSVAGCV